MHPLGLVLAELAGPWTFVSIVALVGAVPVTARVVRRPVTLKAAGVEATIGRIHDTVQGIDRSVNGRPKGDSKLYDLVLDMGAKLEALTDQGAGTHRLLVDHLAAHQAAADEAATST